MEPIMVGQGRLELPTPGLGNQCSVQLSYCPVADGEYDTKYSLHMLGDFLVKYCPRKNV